MYVCMYVIIISFLDVSFGLSWDKAKPQRNKVTTSQCKTQTKINRIKKKLAFQLSIESSLFLAPWCAHLIWTPSRTSLASSRFFFLPTLDNQSINPPQCAQYNSSESIVLYWNIAKEKKFWQPLINLLIYHLKANYNNISRPSILQFQSLKKL